MSSSSMICPECGEHSGDNPDCDICEASSLAMDWEHEQRMADLAREAVRHAAHWEYVNRVLFDGALTDDNDNDLGKGE